MNQHCGRPYCLPHSTIASLGSQTLCMAAHQTSPGAFLYLGIPTPNVWSFMSDTCMHTTPLLAMIAYMLPISQISAHRAQKFAQTGLTSCHSWVTPDQPTLLLVLQQLLIELNVQLVFMLLSKVPLHSLCTAHLIKEVLVCSHHQDGAPLSCASCASGPCADLIQGSCS